MKSTYFVKDYSEKYGSLMQFNKNKSAFIHQWYPFVEGYSREFIYEVLNEINYMPKSVLDPFAGSGTTPVEMQYLGIPCYSFEVSPFMHLLATVKMSKEYSIKSFDKVLDEFQLGLYKYQGEIRKAIDSPAYRTIEPRNGNEEYAFNTAVMTAILKIKYQIGKINSPMYRNLFRIVLASILLEVSNLYRNGKCLSYKYDWRSKRPREEAVYIRFFQRLSEVIRPDIGRIEEYYGSVKKKFDNTERCYFGDARQKIGMLGRGTIDLVITSPPYLNSRDYTDIYMIELWMLDLVKDYAQVRELRKRTIRSHVQVKHGSVAALEIEMLKNVVQKLERNASEHWTRGDDLTTMVKGYFMDMDILFSALNTKMRKGAQVYFNIANSAYCGVEIKVDEIVAQIAETKGFKIKEIREARKLRPSAQQRDKIKFLRESVIVMSA